MAGDSSVGSSYATGGYLETVLGIVYWGLSWGLSWGFVGDLKRSWGFCI